MRSSSVKTAIAAATLAAALTAVALPADARPSQSSRSAATARRSEPTVTERISAAIARLYNSLFGAVANGVPVIPLPPPDQDESNGTRSSKPLEDEPGA